MSILIIVSIAWSLVLLRYQHLCCWDFHITTGNHLFLLLRFSDCYMYAASFLHKYDVLQIATSWSWRTHFKLLASVFLENLTSHGLTSLLDLFESKRLCEIKFGLKSCMRQWKKPLALKLNLLAYYTSGIQEQWTPKVQCPIILFSEATRSNSIEPFVARTPYKTQC